VGHLGDNGCASVPVPPTMPRYEAMSVSSRAVAIWMRFSSADFLPMSDWNRALSVGQFLPDLVFYVALD
jgi:hypothetical protein